MIPKKWKFLLSVRKIFKSKKKKIIHSTLYLTNRDLVIEIQPWIFNTYLPNKQKFLGFHNAISVN